MPLGISRRRGQGLTIEVPAGPGERIHILLSHVERGQCRIAIDAAKHVTVIRDELIECSSEDDKKGAAGRA